MAASPRLLTHFEDIPPESCPDKDVALWMEIPAHLRGGLKRYFDSNCPVGGFLTSVLENNLQEAVTRVSGGSDNEKMWAIRSVCQFLYNCAPRQSHGSRAAVTEWLRKKISQ